MDHLDDIAQGREKATVEGKLRTIVKSSDGIWRGTLTNKPNGWRIKHPDEGPIEGESLIPIREDQSP
jgi:hypothetical protein